MSSQIKEQNLKATAAGTVRLDATNIRLWVSIGTVLLGFLFGGTHVLFGAYPLGLALCSALRSGVWLALLGVVLGSLTLGRSGVIYALIAVLAVFLRVVISGSEKRDKADFTAPFECVAAKLHVHNHSAEEFALVKGGHGLYHGGGTVGVTPLHGTAAVGEGGARLSSVKGRRH